MPTTFHAGRLSHQRILRFIPHSGCSFIYLNNEHHCAACVCVCMSELTCVLGWTFYIDSNLQLDFIWKRTWRGCSMCVQYSYSHVACEMIKRAKFLYVTCHRKTSYWKSNVLSNWFSLKFLPTAIPMATTLPFSIATFPFLQTLPGSPITPLYNLFLSKATAAQEEEEELR